MNAAVVVGLVVLLISGGHCRPQKTSSALLGALEAVQFLTTSSIHKRQTTIPAYITCIANNLQDFIANYPQDCASQIVAAISSIVSNGSLDQDAITAAYRLTCQPRCGDPLIAYYRQCNTPQNIIDAERALCTRNDANVLCYEQVGSIITDLTRVASNCISPPNCTADCQNALTTSARNSGCCINIYNTTLTTSISPFTALQNNLWSRCDVDTPEFCNLERSTLSSAGGPVFVKVLFLLTLAVMAVLLL